MEEFTQVNLKTIKCKAKGNLNIQMANIIRVNTTIIKNRDREPINLIKIKYILEIFIKAICMVKENFKLGIK